MIISVDLLPSLHSLFSYLELPTAALGGCSFLPPSCHLCWAMFTTLHSADNCDCFAGEHCHVRTSKDDTDHIARRKLIVASVVCFCFMIGEATGQSAHITFISSQTSARAVNSGAFFDTHQLGPSTPVSKNAPEFTGRQLGP